MKSEKYQYLESLNDYEQRGLLTEVNIVKWLRDVVRKGKDRVKSQFMKAGNFYNFQYKSKLYEEKRLPYYDANPLILSIGNSQQYGSKYLLGLNTNYLPVRQKKRLIKRLQDRYPEQWDENKTLPNITWDNIKKEIDYNETMIKMYIKGRITDPVKVKNTDMEAMAKMDISRFIGIDVKQVWKDYKNKTSPTTRVNKKV